MSAKTQKDEFRVFYWGAALCAPMIWEVTWESMSGRLPYYGPDLIGEMYIMMIAMSAAFNEFARFMGSTTFARLDDLPGELLLTAWVAVACVLLAFYPDARVPSGFIQCFWATAQVVFLAHLSRRLCRMRQRPDSWRLLPEACDRILAALPAGVGLYWSDLRDLLDGATPNWALSLLKKEGLVREEDREKDGKTRYDFVLGAKKKWEELVSSAFVWLAEEDRPLTADALAVFPFVQDKIRHPHWLARALYRLLKLGLIEQEDRDIPRYRLTELGKDVDDATEIILGFLPYDGSMSIPEIQNRMRAPRDRVQLAMDLLLMADHAEPMAAQPGEKTRYRSTLDPNALFKINPDYEPPKDDDPDQK